MSGAGHGGGGGHDGPDRRLERLDSPVSRLAPEAKLVGLVAFLLVMAVTPPSKPWALLAQGGLAVLVAFVALADPRAIAGRLVVDLPLAVLAVVYAICGRGPRTEVLGSGLTLSVPGLQVGLGVLAKATIGVVAVSAVAAATTPGETVAGLRRLRVPPWFCDLLALVTRQVGLLRADLGRLQLAARVRAGTCGWRARWRAATRAFGTLFVRSTERLDRLQLALEARGGVSFAGAPFGRSPRRAGALPAARAPQWLGGLLPAAAALLARGLL